MSFQKGSMQFQKHKALRTLTNQPPNYLMGLKFKNDRGANLKSMVNDSASSSAHSSNVGSPDDKISRSPVIRQNSIQYPMLKATRSTPLRKQTVTSKHHSRHTHKKQNQVQSQNKSAIRKKTTDPEMRLNYIDIMVAPYTNPLTIDDIELMRFTPEDERKNDSPGWGKVNQILLNPQNKDRMKRVLTNLRKMKRKQIGWYGLPKSKEQEQKYIQRLKQRKVKKQYTRLDTTMSGNSVLDIVNIRRQSKKLGQQLGSDPQNLSKALARSMLFEKGKQKIKDDNDLGLKSQNKIGSNEKKDDIITAETLIVPQQRRSVLDQQPAIIFPVQQVTLDKQQSMKPNDILQAMNIIQKQQEQEKNNYGICMLDDPSFLERERSKTIATRDSIRSRSFSDKANKLVRNVGDIILSQKRQKLDDDIANTIPIPEEPPTPPSLAER